MGTRFMNKLKIQALILSAIALFAMPAFAQSQRHAKLTWTPSTEYVDHTPIPAGTPISYCVYVGTTAANIVQVAKTKETEVDTDAIGLTVGKYVAVKATDGQVESDLSSVLHYNPPSAVKVSITSTIEMSQ